ncbi:S9 family peptidase [Simiduia aestuariiviva]|uniref:Oligopeptidase B n=1 Tax=Simiduia aestuariiviva TaxID=1510459 RepID=A0A839UP57_9GAMM|nr:S9 family peptidase [Simiduia aestuariiviva]MBB3167536.1 oligopeptidase B [Simiduia aestuariiviva]
MKQWQLIRRGLPLCGLALTALCFQSCSQQPTAPVAQQQPKTVTAPHGAERMDEYYWLRDDSRADPQMLAYLHAENAYADQLLASSAPLRDQLYEEFVGRIKQDDASVPYLKHGYWYYSRYETGKDYPIVARRKGSMEAPEEILLDQNAMAAGRDYFKVGNWEVSPDNQWLAWAEDTNGRRQYTLRAKRIATGELLPDVVTGAAANMLWGDDNRSLWYVENDPITLLSKRVKVHKMGTPTGDDTLVYHEPDDSFYMGIGRTRSEKYICIGVQSTVSSEQRCTLASDPGEFHVIAARQRDHLYEADHLNGRWVIKTDWQAPNSRVMVMNEGQWNQPERWTEMIPHSDTVLIMSVTLFDDFIAVGERSEGLRRIRIMRPQQANEWVSSDEPAYTMGVDVNPEASSKWLRYSYTSLTTPERIYEVNIDTGERRLLKEEPVLGDFSAENYVTERLWVDARDGTKIPVSIAYRKGFKKDGSAPLLQYAYGSYGSSSDPRFGITRPSLMDRGVVFAIAHIRGGQEMGRSWYDDGKLFNKMNSFTDFIDVTRELVAQGFAAPDRVAAMGGSAGGLLMGGVANMAPADYRVMLSLVPFVDVVTTMLDPSIPLTTNEYDEWGNPEQTAFYDYMLQYSPYDQLEAKQYPAMFVGTGLWDSQVQYWEPAKYVARLRRLKTDDNPLVFRVNMEAGHGGKSGRFQRYKESAEYFAFMLQQLGVAP